MYAHVGRHRLEQYFSTLSRLLEPHGLMLNSGIARPATSGDDDTTLFVRRFVFPGGELPYLSEIVAAAERAGLEVIRIENLRRHYALTCAAWVRRLQAHREQCLRLVDARTYRTWLLYLAAAAASFDRGDLELYHILFAHRGEMDPAGPVSASATTSRAAGSEPPAGS
jgi:cyclopropane-fatty-acyl-phospholipid synthase